MNKFNDERIQTKTKDKADIGAIRRLDVNVNATTALYGMATNIISDTAMIHMAIVRRTSLFVNNNNTSFKYY